MPAGSHAGIARVDHPGQRSRPRDQGTAALQDHRRAVTSQQVPGGAPPVRLHRGGGTAEQPARLARVRRQDPAGALIGCRARRENRASASRFRASASRTSGRKPGECPPERPTAARGPSRPGRGRDRWQRPWPVPATAADPPACPMPWHISSGRTGGSKVPHWPAAWRRLTRPAPARRAASPASRTAPAMP